MNLDFRPLPSPPPERLKDIEASVLADLKPVRPLAPPAVYMAAMAAVFVGICLLGWRFIVGQLGWEALSNLQRTLVFVPLMASAALLIFSVVRQMSPVAAQARTTAILAGVVFLALLVLMAFLFQPMRESAFVHNAYVCFRAGMLFALPAAVGFALLLSRGAGLSPRLSGAAAGGLAGLVGLTILEIHCPNLNVYHIVAGHIPVTLVCALAGLVFSSVTFRRRISNQ